MAFQHEAFVCLGYNVSGHEWHTSLKVIESSIRVYSDELSQLHCFKIINNQLVPVLDYDALLRVFD